jgi:hypothetical protein
MKTINPLLGVALLTLLFVGKCCLSDSSLLNHPKDQEGTLFNENFSPDDAELLEKLEENIVEWRDFNWRLLHKNMPTILQICRQSKARCQSLIPQGENLLFIDNEPQGESDSELEGDPFLAGFNDAGSIAVRNAINEYKTMKRVNRDFLQEYYRIQRETEFYMESERKAIEKIQISSVLL